MVESRGTGPLRVLGFDLVATTGEKSGFWDRMETRYVAPPGALVLEDLGFMVRLPVFNGVGTILDAALISAVLLANGELEAAYSAARR